MMHFYRNILVLLLVFVVGFGCSEKQNKPERPNRLLLISFDGFRHDYFSQTDMPNFDAFVTEGVKAEGLIPVFPTKTFPSHYSIATGLYPQNSGLVGNTMYDPEFDEWYRISDREAVQDAKWYKGEPIWNTAEKQGLKAGTMFWIGSEADIQGMRSTFWKPYDGALPGRARIDTVVKWLSYPEEKRVDFATLYFSDIDRAGHHYGPASDSLKTALQRADSLLAYLETQMNERNLWDKTNIVVVSDHGMAPLAKDKIILLDTIIDTTKVERMTWGAISMIQPKEGEVEAVYNQLKAHENHYRVFKKDDLPERFHLKDSRRIPSLVVVPDLSYMTMEEKYKQPFIEGLPAGMHGYDNNEKAMQGIFLARGPAFRKGAKTASFQSIHIYDLMSHILGIKPAPNDGSLDSVKIMLKELDV